MKLTTGAASGTRYGELTVIRVVKSGRKAIVECKCDCGNLYTGLLSKLREREKTKRGRSCCSACTSIGDVEIKLNRFDPTQYMLKRFGRLLVTGIEVVESKRAMRHHMVCLCDCGCLRSEIFSEIAKQNLDHGHSVNGEIKGRTPLYTAWLKVLAGARVGLKVAAPRVCHEYDARWDDYKNFLADFGEIERHRTISRKNDQLPWDRDNCFINVGRRGRQTNQRRLPEGVAPR